MEYDDVLTGRGLHLRSLARLKTAIGAFREIDSKMPTAYADAFLAVTLRPGFGPSEYARMIGTIQPIASRILMEIGEKARERDEPLHLVASRQHPENRRCLQYYLTPRGYALAERAGWALQGRQTGS